MCILGVCEQSMSEVRQIVSKNQDISLKFGILGQGVGDGGEVTRLLVLPGVIGWI